MNLKKLMKESRKGSYLVEASLTLPVLILGTISLALIINLIAFCETVCFVTSRELKEQTYCQNKLIGSVSLSRSIVSGVEEEWQNRFPFSGFQVKRVRAGVESGSLDELISVTVGTDVSFSTPVGIDSGAGLSGRVMARAFTGTLQDASPLGEDRFNCTGSAVDVTVYPKYGQRFHVETCSVVQQERKDGNPGWVIDLEEAKMQEFTPCMICGGGIR